jgi:lambda family phage portal protein
MKPLARLNLVDRIIGYFNPQASINRIKYRSALAAAASTGYITFGSGKKSMRGAFATNNSADQDIIPKIDSMRASSRDLYMNSPIATGALRRARTNIIGYGLTLQPRIDRGKLQLTDEQAEIWEQNVDREFSLWAESKFCDITRTQNFYDLQGLVLLSALMSGDCFVLMPYVKANNFPYELTLKILEADLICNPANVMDSDKLAGGVEVNDNGAPVKYYVRKQHPGSLNPSYDFITIDAYGQKSGRRNVLHVFDKERPGQRRGIPMLAPVIEKLKQLTRLSEAELMAAVVSSFFTAFITSEVRESDPVNDGYAGTENSVKTPLDTSVNEMGSGTIIDLVPGEKVELADPKRPNQAFEPFFTAMLREVGSALEIPFELLILHFTASYSASRAALLEAWKFFLQKRTWLEREFCKPVYEEFLAEAVSKGRIKAPGFFIDYSVRQAWSGSKWSGPGQGQLNPVQETQAALMRVNGNLSTLAKETAAIDGDNWFTMINQRSREISVLDSKGMNIKIDTSKKQEPDNVRDNEEKIDE